MTTSRNFPARPPISTTTQNDRYAENKMEKSRLAAQRMRYSVPKKRMPIKLAHPKASSLVAGDATIGPTPKVCQNRFQLYFRPVLSIGVDAKAKRNSERLLR